MKTISSLTAVLLCFSCEASQKPIDETKYLKDIGYKNVYCDKIQSVNENVIEIYTLIEPISYNKHMIIARCRQKNCEYEDIPFFDVPKKFVCLSYYLNKENNLDEQTILSYNIEKFKDIKN